MDFVVKRERNGDGERNTAAKVMSVRTKSINVLVGNGHYKISGGGRRKE